MDLHPYISICSGAGGLDIGVDRGSGGTTVPVCYVENELTAAATLVSNIKKGTLVDAPIWSDIKTFDFAAWRGQVDGIVGGYPCQPFSSGGQRLGEADPRHLWPIIKSGIEAVRPVWCFFENVANHLFIGFDEVARSLQNMGYEVAATLVSAEQVGASHQRERLFILGYSCREGSQGSIQQRIVNLGGRARQNDVTPRSGGSMGNTTSNRGQNPIVIAGSSSRSSIEMELPSRFAYGPTDSRWVGVPHGLQPSLPKPEFCRMADGLGNWLDISRNDRLRILGNGVVPDAAARAWVELWNEVG